MYKDLFPRLRFFFFALSSVTGVSFHVRNSELVLFLSLALSLFLASCLSLYSCLASITWFIHSSSPLLMNICLFFCHYKQDRNQHPHTYTPLCVMLVLIEVELVVQRAMCILSFDRFSQIVFPKSLYEFIFSPETCERDPTSSPTLGLSVSP